MAVGSRGRKSKLVNKLLGRSARKTRKSNHRSRLAVGQQFESLESRLLLATFAPSKDNSLYENAAGLVSNGSGVNLFAGRTAEGSNNLRRALVAFDVTSIPAGSVVTDVRLDLSVTRDPAGATPPHNFSLHRVTQDWGEGTSVAGGPGGTGTPAASNDATWIHRLFNTSTWTTPGGDFEAAASATSSVGNSGTTASWSSPTLIADVQGWVNNPESNFGWILIGDESAARTARRFGSREGGAAPVLDVTFTEPTPTVSLAVDTPTLTEVGGAATFTATLSSAATQDITVDLGFSGDATQNVDYSASATQITIATGATTGSVTITAIDDTIDEPDESVVVDIIAVSPGASEDGVQQATTTITDDDLPTVTLAVDNAAIAEAGGTAIFTATLSAAAGTDVTVDLGFTGTATNPDDYTASATQITIAAGATSGSVIVTTVDDTADEEDETIVVDITEVVGATEDGDQQATTVITDDDLPTVTLAVDNAEIAESVTSTSSADFVDIFPLAGVEGYTPEQMIANVGGEFVDAAATITYSLDLENGQTNVQIDVANTVPDMLFTAWLRLAEPQPIVCKAGDAVGESIGHPRAWRSNSIHGFNSNSCCSGNYRRRRVRHR